jgi:hypothetical protein
MILIGDNINHRLYAIASLILLVWYTSHTDNALCHCEHSGCQWQHTTVPGNTIRDHNQWGQSTLISLLENQL